MMRKMMMAALIAALAMTANATTFRWAGWFGAFDGSNGEDWLYGTDSASSDMGVIVWVYNFGPDGPAPVFDADSFDLMAGTLTSVSGALGDSVGINQVSSGAFTDIRWEEPGTSSWFGGTVMQASWYAVVVMIDAPGYEGLFGIDLFKGDHYMDTWENPDDEEDWGFIDPPVDFVMWWAPNGVDIDRRITFLDLAAMEALELEYGRISRTDYMMYDSGQWKVEEYVFSPDGFFGVIPEPATGLLALAGIALLIRRKRR